MVFQFGNSISRYSSLSLPAGRRSSQSIPVVACQRRFDVQPKFAAGWSRAIHVNADFDEVVHYVRGPGAGHCTEPGTLTWSKGVVHHGPKEDVAEGYAAGLLETRATLRWTPEAIAELQLMETENYARHPSAAQTGR